jgi:hypothetical protein
VKDQSDLPAKTDTLVARALLDLKVQKKHPEIRELKESRANKAPLEIPAASVPKEKLVPSVPLDLKANLAKLANLDILDL